MHNVSFLPPTKCHDGKLVDPEDDFIIICLHYLWLFIVTQRVWISTQHVLLQKESNWLPFSIDNKFSFSISLKLFNDFLMFCLRCAKVVKCIITSLQNHLALITRWTARSGNHNDLRPQWQDSGRAISNPKINWIYASLLSRVRKFTHSICIQLGSVCKHDMKMTNKLN